jgi:SPP1 gp7 family putative phage head morphogenesis protein
MSTQDLFDRNIEHLLLTKRYHETSKLLIEKVAREHRRSLRDLLKKNIKADLKAQIELYANQLFDSAKNSVGGYVSAELDFQVNSLKRSVGPWYQVTSVNRGALEKEILKTPLKLALESKQHGTLASSIGNITQSELTRINARIRRGIVDGTDEAILIKEVLKSSKLSENQAKTLVSTNLTQAEAIVKDQVLKENSDVISGVVFTAILDSRTSATCSHYDDLFQPIDAIKIKPPLHWNCRSSLVPVLKPKKAILESNSHRINKELLAAVPDTELSGQLPIKENFEAWLKRQAMSVKLKHLGTEERVTMFEDGRLPISDFFNSLGRPISLAALRMKDNAINFIRTHRQPKTADLSGVTRPFQLVRSKENQRALEDLLIAETTNPSAALALTDYRGTTLAGKRGVRHRSLNEFDERNTSFDPFTGEVRSTFYYDPDFSLYRERLDYMKQSKALDRNQKVFIENFAEGLEGKVSVNQQTAIVENLRIVFERYENKKIPWEDFSKVVKAELNYSVVNTSRLLDRRSRERAELFLGFRGDPKEPAVMIQGQRVTLEQLTQEKITYERYVRGWKEKEGRELATEMYYSGNAPWQTYFLDQAGPPKSLGDKIYDSIVRTQIKKLFYKDDPAGYYLKYGKKPDSVTKLIKKEIESALKGDTYKFLKKVNDEGVYNFVSRTLREEYRKIIDLEFFYAKKRRSILDTLFTAYTNKKNDREINLLAGLLETVAEGTTTDYDSLAINLGKTLKDRYPGLFTYQGARLEDFHREGSKILEFLKDQKMIKVNSRGVVRRSVVDLDTNRPSGAWKDTVSREVSIIDPTMLKLQDYNRRIELSNRIGVSNPQNKYYVVPGKKTYVDARGADTGIPVVTRSAFPTFDEKQIDKDFADMLNHTMSSEFIVDNEFTGFMDDLVRFKDPRGNTEYYDNLNGLRQEIIKRGDLGYGMMETIRYYRSTGRPFSAHARIDGRGRVYFNGYLNPTGGELVRPFLDSARAVGMTPAGLKQIKIQVAATIGPAQEALTTRGRLAIFDRHEKELLKMGELISATTQRDRRLREFLELELVQELDPKEVPKIARYALEYYRLHRHTGGDFSPEKMKTFLSHLMGEADASASGLQVIALSTGNRNSAIVSNILPTMSKQRIYDLVAQDTYADERFQKLMDELGINLTWEDLSKASKYQVMISFYGAGQTGVTARVADELSKILKKRDVLVTSNKDFLTIRKLVDNKIKEAKALGADDVVADLESLKLELKEMINSPDFDGSDLLVQAAELHPDLEDFVTKYTDRRGPQIGPQQFKEIAAIMSEKLSERSPQATQFIKFWKLVGDDFAKTTKKVDIPWVTFDGKKLMQRYRPKLQYEARFFDPVSKRYVRNIYQMSAPEGALLGKASIGDVRLGLGVNGNHANDATLVRGYHLWGRKNGFQTNTIHDAMFMNVNELDQGIQGMYEVYARALEFDNLKATLDAMLEAGLPKDRYDFWLSEAERLGLREHGFTAEEILQEIKPGYDRYGWGP